MYVILYSIISKTLYLGNLNCIWKTRNIIGKLKCIGGAPSFVLLFPSF